MGNGHSTSLHGTRNFHLIELNAFIDPEGFLPNYRFIIEFLWKINYVAITVTGKPHADNLSIFSCSDDCDIVSVPMIKSSWISVSYGGSKRFPPFTDVSAIKSEICSYRFGHHFKSTATCTHSSTFLKCKAFYVCLELFVCVNLKFRNFWNTSCNSLNEYAAASQEPGGSPAEKQTLFGGRGWRVAGNRLMTPQLLQFAE